MGERHCASPSLSFAHSAEITLVCFHLVIELVAGELASDELAQAEDADRGVGLNADDLNASTGCAARYKVLSQRALLALSKATVALIRRRHDRTLYGP